MNAAGGVDLADARAAIAEVVPRLSALVRSIDDTERPALGEWSVGDVAVHLAHVWEALPALAAGTLESPIQELGGLAGLTAGMVRDEPDRDMATMAGRIERGAAAFLEASQAARPDGAWLVAGITASTATFACHLLNESLVHGDDIARAARRHWPIEPDHAALAIKGFVFPVLGLLDPRALVDQRRAAGFHACYDIRVGGGGRVFMVFDDGAVAIEAPSSRRVDCHISGQPAALLLVLWARRSQWSMLLRGRLRAWGRRPWLAPRLTTLMRNR